MKQHFSYRARRLSGSISLPALFFVILSLCGISATGQSAELLVMYPEVRAPFSKIFDDISAGAEEGFVGDTSSVAIREGEEVGPLLTRKKPDVVLALGKRSVSSLKASNKNVLTILGAVSEEQYGYSGISMVPDPEVILDKLILLSPAVKQVHVVKKSSGMDVQLEGASEYLSKHGKTLNVHESEDIRQAATIYAELIEEANAGDSIWILQDGSYVNSAIFSLLLDAAWSKSLVVFSSNPLHVKRGALFAVYPNNRDMGESLGKLANKALNNEVKPGLQPLRDVSVAVNERTGNHLGLALTAEVKDSIDLLLPAR
ncbi:MAG: ABC transporter substrate binding protein [Porticoccus sp.]